MGPETRVPKIQIADVDLHNFSRCATSATKTSHRVISRWVDRDAVQSAKFKQHLLTATSRARLHVQPSRAPPNNNFILPPRPRCMFSSRGMLNPRPEDVDFYICEYFGQMPVTVGEFTPCFEKQPCFPSRDLIVQRPISRTAHCSRNATLSYRLHWNECAQLTLISARDFNVTDASRTMRARF